MILSAIRTRIEARMPRCEKAFLEGMKEPVLRRLDRLQSQPGYWSIGSTSTCRHRRLPAEQLAALPCETSLWA